MGNSNLGLRFSGNLYEGARAWYFSVARETEARFNLSQKVPNSFTNLKFYAWYVIADPVPGYNINSTHIKKIKDLLQATKGSKTVHSRGTGTLPQAGFEVDPTGAVGQEARLAEESQ